MAELTTSIDGFLHIEPRYILEPPEELFTILPGIDSAGHFHATMSSESRPAHRWHNEEKLTLCLLSALYNNPLRDLFKVFNSIFQGRFDGERKLDGLSFDALKAMLYHLQVVKYTDHPWAMIQGLSTKEMRQKFSEQREHIENAAIDTEVELRLKVNNDDQTRRLKHTFKARLARSEQKFRQDTPESSLLDPGTDTDIDQSPLEARARRLRLSHRSAHISPPLPPPPPTPPIRKPVLLMKRKSNTENLKRQHPVLLFRAFDPLHKFKSRQVLKNGYLVHPPRYYSRKFREAVLPHLQVDTRYHSPFISFGDNPLSILNKVKSNHSLSFAIFEFEELNHDLQRRFGKEHGLYLVTDICKNVHNLDNLPGGYTGSGEWLAWGSVNTKPIAILSASEAIALHGIIKTTRSVDFETGQRIGQRLSAVPPVWREVVAYKLSRAFRTKAYRHRPAGRAYNAFIDGVYSVTGNGSRVTSVIPDDTESLEDDQSEFVNPIHGHDHHNGDDDDDDDYNDDDGDYNDGDYDDGDYNDDDGDYNDGDYDDGDHQWTDWRSDTVSDEDILPSTTTLCDNVSTTMNSGEISTETIRSFRRQIENFQAQAEVLLSRLPPAEMEQAPTIIDLTLNSESEDGDEYEDHIFI